MNDIVLLGMCSYAMLLAHLIGDYLLQSDWMALKKTEAWWPATAHAGVYTLAFIPVWEVYGVQRWTLLIVFGTHLLIDRYRLARFVCFAKNHLAPRFSVTGRPTTLTTPGNQAELRPGQFVRVDDQEAVIVPANGKVQAVPIDVHWQPWNECQGTGYHKSRPAWLTVWLLIITDNTMHLACNAAALMIGTAYLPPM